MIPINKQQQLQELYTDWNELEAYRNLNGQSFDFGTGLIILDDSKSEDVYWKLEQYAIDNCIDDLENNFIFKYKRKYFKNKENYYLNKVYDKEKLQHLKDTTWWAVWFKNKYDETKPQYLVRAWFATNTRRFYKKYSNHQVRKHNDFKMCGNGYRKVFDLWNEIW